MNRTLRERERESVSLGERKVEWEKVKRTEEGGGKMKGNGELAYGRKREMK